MTATYIATRIVLGELDQKLLADEWIRGAYAVVNVSSGGQLFYAVRTWDPTMYKVTLANQTPCMIHWKDCQVIYENINGNIVLTKSPTYMDHWNDVQYAILDGANRLGDDQKAKEVYCKFKCAQIMEEEVRMDYLTKDLEVPSSIIPDVPDLFKTSFTEGDAFKFSKYNEPSFPFNPKELEDIPELLCDKPFQSAENLSLAEYAESIGVKLRTEITEEHARQCLQPVPPMGNNELAKFISKCALPKI